MHVKDGYWDEKEQKSVFTFPGEGHADVRRIVADLLRRKYDGGFSMEPHLAVVYHDKSVTAPDEIRYRNYVEYGRRFMRLVEEVRKTL